MLQLFFVAASEAVGALRANLLRTLLSTLGIVIGVAALVAILGLGDGMERFGREQVSSKTDVSAIVVAPITGEEVDGIYLEKQNVTPLTPADAAQAKYWCTELQQRSIDKCLQLFGGYGYMTEYPIARAYADARITSIYGGTTEVMKTIIARSLGI